MDWVLVIVILILAYAFLAAAIHRMRNNVLARLPEKPGGEGTGDEYAGVEGEPHPEMTRWERFLVENIMFYGPIIAIKTDKAGFFDRFLPFSFLFRLYGTIGVIAVAAVSVLITASLFFAFRMTLLNPPEPTGIYAPQNIFLIPGVNEFVPSTIAVWLALIIAIGIHESGHGILCRVENIAVKGVGALVAVIPIGFFVEPDETALEKRKGLPKMRMFGAGITNNLVIGIISIVLMVLLAGLAVPTNTPVIQGVYQNYSADIAGVPANSLITGINGIDVQSRDDVSAILNGTRPGDTVSLEVLQAGNSETYNLTLTNWPDMPEYRSRTSGFMGVSYYDGSTVIAVIRNSLSPLGFLRLMTIPFDTSSSGQVLKIVAFETPDVANFAVPVPVIFWGLVHLLFWLGWININIGLFNAIPMIPLDGGYIFKESVDRLFEKRGLGKYSIHVVSVVSSLMLVILFALVALPYLLNG